MQEGKLTVVVPAHNESNYIRKCLEALLEQHEDIHEILVVDNNSSDGTAQIVDSISAEYPIVRRVFEERPGVVFARNAGFEAASGEFIGRIDADTRVRPGWAKTVLEYFVREDSSKVGAICGLNNSYDSPFRAVKGLFVKFLVKVGVYGGEKRVGNLHGANMALRKSAWERVRESVSLDPVVHEDLDLALCLRKNKLEISQLDAMFVDISPRRAYTPPSEYTRYIESGFATFNLHGLLTPKVRRIVRLQWWCHAFVYMSYKFYDPAIGRFSLRRQVSDYSSRAMPIDLR
ncbi:glycosyltransferase [Rhodococcus sp. RDE2]|uniref:glycosyltransferase n=1 Tax=Rhodococcus sp. RDE2 TaxID=2885078 RepID=UPI001E30993F|nr:glycosyltransferase family 2 protein [Rhodococcus sp. RDE2]BDB61761.1 glycosyl transferase [Rhodococcus sp. RDE2]